MENYEKLKEVIQKANPEIMELKFGCEVIAPKGSVFIIIGRRLEGSKKLGGHTSVQRKYRTPGTVIAIQKDYFEAKLDRSQYVQTFLPQQIKILGRPIRLADVLLAMRGRIKIENGLEMMDVKGTYAFSDAQTSLIRPWNLKDDNLDNQSPECKEFLIKLLVNK